MGLFNRNSDTSPEAQELREAQKALAADPVNRGDLGYVSVDSPAGRANQAAQQRVADAEAALKNSN